MMESPLFLTRVECPVCGTVNEFENIRVGAYTEGERQTDFCPSFIKWRNPKYQKYHPLLFFAATCSQCFYTREFNAKFREWSKDNNFRAYRQKIIKEKHLGDMTSDVSLIKMIGSALEQDRYPDETAILKLLLAIYDESLNEHPSALDLGRFYLRVAWMFRHRNIGQTSDGNEAAAGHREDLEKGITEFEIWLSGLQRHREYLQASVEASCDHGAVVVAPESPIRERATAIMARTAALEQEGQQIAAGLRALVTDLRLAENGETEQTGTGSFHEYPDFESFLARLITMWGGIPRNEFEAIRFAARHYQSAFETGKEISHGNQSLQAAYLIAELSRQIGDHDNGRKYFNTTIKMGQEYINEIRGDRTRTALARKILELALSQGKLNLVQAK